MTENVRKRIRFHGDVQAVGFRWKASQTADHFGLTGWVRNEWDGTVLMEIQGQEELIDQLLVRLYRDKYIVIDHMDIKNIPVDEEERSFRVTGY